MYGAELLDAYRIIPRLIMIGYGYMCWDVYQWAIAHPELETGKWLVGAIFGVAGIVSSAYMNSGKKWGGNGQG